jgi:DNA invertase Pin-like site-specific DNA recombinase
MTGPRLRCAIYTRKSTEEGLDQDYNSLEAQRDACAAYIASQAGEGWAVVKTPYDDGGLSGATMERPALQHLLDDIRAGAIDVVVVYKVDRLTRSLADFAKIVEILDAEQVSFVSVTQQFNTTSSMGRLTLNVLLSFAQFEREVTAERIRDKIAASKKKGMWMGGVVPLGYDVVDRKLVVNEEEAKTVRTLFDLYRDRRTVKAVQEEAARRGLRTKAGIPNTGSRDGGVPFRVGHLHKLLTNCIYVGEIGHKGERYPGEHAPIVDRALWDAVQAQLEANARKRSRRSNDPSGSLLIGLLYDEDGRRIGPHHCNKNGRRYRYYVSRDPEARTGWRMPARMIETAVLDGIAAFLRDKMRLTDALNLTAIPAQDIDPVFACAQQLANELRASGPARQRSILLDLVDRIEMSQSHIRLCLKRNAVRAMLGLPEQRDAAKKEEIVSIDLPVSFRRRGVETKLIIGSAATATANVDKPLTDAVTTAHAWFSELKSGAHASIKALATHHRVDKGDVSRILPLAFLAPDIVDAILDGRQPIELTAYRLKRLHNLPPLWDDQRKVLGFS